jgi:hypothetical protein
MNGVSQKSESKNKEFKVGQKVWYNKTIWEVRHVYTIFDQLAIESNTTRVDVNTCDVTPIKVAPTVAEKDKVIKNYWGEQELTGEDESWNFGEPQRAFPKCRLDPMYCSCSNPNLKTNIAYGSTFEFCKTCRKEKI